MTRRGGVGRNVGSRGRTAPEQAGEGGSFATPVVDDHIGRATPEQVAEGEGGNDRVVERAQDRHELGDQVEGVQQPEHAEREHDLGGPGDTGVAEEITEKQDQVGDQRDELSCRGALPREEQDRDQQRPDGDRDPDSDQEGPHAMSVRPGR